jgi:hypothetical protein
LAYSDRQARVRNWRVWISPMGCSSLMEPD